MFNFKNGFKLLSLSMLISVSFQSQASNFSQFFSGTTSTNNSGRAVFNRDSTWTVPAGVTKISVQVIGAGGGGAHSSGGGGGGGGGSCIKNGATVLASANGGKGANTNESQGQPGSINTSVLSVTAGDSLNIYVGGGGGGGGYGAAYHAGGGGYGACGDGGAGGNGSTGIGGTGGANKGGGGGAALTAAGGNAGSTTGGTGATGGSGGSASAGGASSLGGGGGGASGAVGGIGGYNNYGFAASSGRNTGNTLGLSGGTAGDAGCGGAVTVEPGSGGIIYYCSTLGVGTLGGGGGQVIISW